MSRPAPYFSRVHPLADVAARHCEKHTGRRGADIGRIACGPCWELAIRDDERFAVRCGLPREIEPDPDYIDEIAVELACRGERVALTKAEFAAAAKRLQAKGLPPTRIAMRLHTSYGAVQAVLTPVPVPIPVAA